MMTGAALPESIVAWTAGSIFAAAASGAGNGAWTMRACRCAHAQKAAEVATMNRGTVARMQQCRRADLRRDGPVNAAGTAHSDSDTSEMISKHWLTGGPRVTVVA